MNECITPTGVVVQSDELNTLLGEGDLISPASTTGKPVCGRTVKFVGLGETFDNGGRRVASEERFWLLQVPRPRVQYI